ncbi:MAG: linear amide C-N hydrolase [Candidatus Eisenbacteria bacterium]|nr:linear amide C-N hydrolase [bacterium]MBU1700126.1 linear amide C-N hydrolase [Candidatus Eisenbacteria bacterium]
MQSKGLGKLTMILTVGLMVAIARSLMAQDELINLKFEEPPIADSDETRSLESLVKVQGTGQFCEDGLYLMTQYGEREELFIRENQKLIDLPLINQPWRYCSVFSSANEEAVFMGRNWDNQNVGSIIVSLNYPPDGYSSISFSRSIDVGFGHKDLEEFISSPFGNSLLLAPFYAMDGINEHGLSVAVAGDKTTEVHAKEDKELIFISYLIRRILDQTKTVEEAVELAGNYVPFLIDENTLASHLMVADASGGSVILEYDGEQWRTTYTDKSWQVMSTKRVFNIPDADMRENCWRFTSMSENLEEVKGIVDWKASMGFLQDVEQKGTTWSIVYSLRTTELYFSVYQEWDTVYHIELP